MIFSNTDGKNKLFSIFGLIFFEPFPSIKSKEATGKPIVARSLKFYLKDFTCLKSISSPWNVLGQSAYVPFPSRC